MSYERQFNKFVLYGLDTRNLDFVACDHYHCYKIEVTVGNVRDITVSMYEPGTHNLAFFDISICVNIYMRKIEACKLLMGKHSSRFRCHKHFGTIIEGDIIKIILKLWSKIMHY